MQLFALGPPNASPLLAFSILILAIIKTASPIPLFSGSRRSASAAATLSPYSVARGFGLAIARSKWAIIACWFAMNWGERELMEDEGDELSERRDCWTKDWRARR